MRRGFTDGEVVALDPELTRASSGGIDVCWGVEIPLRDGVCLSATLYRPKGSRSAAPCVFILTPYIAQTYHDRGCYFAAHGYPFLTVDARGRGNSEGVFNPFAQEAHDGYDVVEWLATQPYCNGKVAMWGGSYGGTNQWSTAKEFPPHLASIVPVASACMAVDFPMRNNVSYPYLMQWLVFTSGHTLQDKIFSDQKFWSTKYREFFESGKPFKDLDSFIGHPSPLFQKWITHPQPDAHWDSVNPSAAQYAAVSLPILTITGSHDDDQPGALAHYREHIVRSSPEAAARHYLVIGPWDHPGTRTPSATFGGLSFGPESLVDLPKLHVDWYAWTMQGGPRPAFLQKRVAYYVMGADNWRYADTLDAVTQEERAYFLDSTSNADDALAAGTLGPQEAHGAPDHCVYDPRDVSHAELEAGTDPLSFTDQTMLYAQRGKQLVYHSAPFGADIEVSGFFRLLVWLGIDQPDTDFIASVYEIRPNGTSIQLTTDLLRARYREGLRAPKLIGTKDALQYDFERFTFVSRQIKRGSRLRLRIAPINSIFHQKNYNSGKEVAAESMQDARVMTVRLYHDNARKSALYVPIGQPDGAT